jgi:hypothetical protein
MNVKKSLSSSALKWDQKGCTHFLVVRGAFGERVEMSDERLRADLSGAIDGMENDDFVPVGGVLARLISSAEFARNTASFTIAEQAASYTAFGCNRKDGEITLYVPDNDACKNRIDISQSVRVTVEKEPKKFMKRETGNYNVRVTLSGDYSDGQLCYSVGGYRYPITKRMAQSGFTVGAEPVVASQDTGLRIE